MTVDATEAGTNLGVLYRFQGEQCTKMGSPFYGRLCELLAEDAERGGPLLDVMGERANLHFDDAYHLRLLGGLHRMALTGEAPQLRVHYPSTGGDGDADAVWSAVEALLADCTPSLLDALDRPLQTNEVGRAAPLASGLALVAAETGLPLRLLEIGSSAALNLRLDRYRYEAAGAAWGDPTSPVRFVDVWDGGVPPFDEAVTVAARRGCDLAPVDVTDPDAAVTLLSFVWPGQVERFERLHAALGIARGFPVDVDAEPVDTWLPRQLAEPVPGVATVVFHSIVWQYLPGATRDTVVSTLHDAGARATDRAPLAWIRLEPSPGIEFAELRATTWPGGEERVLAHTGFHAARIQWFTRRAR